MDPNATLAAFWEAIERGNLHDAYEHKQNLLDWVKRGGFRPDDLDGYKRMIRFNCGT